ncbi:hypothetical protein [Flavobacterium sp.]|uniref:hypothetical protein n=1 Tax=Flavobacterium sp. TaxID=239 RepID=UPI003750FC7A
MNTQNFIQSGGFPIETETLNEMQKAYSLFNSLGYLAGNFSIISGCIKTGSIVSDGAVFINGELLEFKGGNIGTDVVIVQTVSTNEFEDGTEKDVLFTRYATFGIDPTSFPWINFKRCFPTTQIQAALDLKEDKTTIELLIERIEILENKPSNIPIGFVGIWTRPFNEIPLGWVEHVPLRGRIPVGLNPDILGLDVLNSFGGATSKTLSIAEMPAHNHKQGSEALYNFFGGGDAGTSRQAPPSGTFPLFSQQLTSTTGAAQSFSIMNPYRIVHYIKYVGL